MQDRLIRDFELYFPLIAEEAVRYNVNHKYNELIVTMQNGHKILFDGNNHSFRQLPDIYDMTDRDVKNEFGKRLRKIMELKCVTQEKLADASGIQQSNLSLYIHGKVNPTYTTAYKIARALGCSMDDFGYWEV